MDLWSRCLGLALWLVLGLELAYVTGSVFIVVFLHFRMQKVTTKTLT